MQVKYRPDIDGLRAIAVCLVLLFHAWPRFLPGGFVGVDVFFVISGFLITGIIFREASDNKFDYLNFYARRLRRIGPALLLVISVSLTVGFLFLPYGIVRELAIEAAAGAGFSANFLFWYQADYFDALNGTKPLLHLWSLGVEEQFYFIWPTLIVLAIYLNRRLRVPVATLMMAFVVVSFAINIWTTETSQQSAFYLLPSRLWQLGLGGALAILQHRQRSFGPTFFNVQAALGVMAIFLSATLFNELQAYPGWRAAVPTFGAALVINAGRSSWINRSVLGSIIPRWIGLISYPMYLWHWPALVLLNLTGYATGGIKAVVLGSTVVASYLTYEFIEKPIRVSKSQGGRWDRIPQVIFASLMAVTAISVLLPRLHLGVFETPRWAVLFDEKKDEYRSAYRYGSCFLTRDQTGAGFGQNCFWNARSDKPRWLLWGDSHAAHLYPGLSNKAGTENFELAQLTSSACPPIVGLNRVPMSHNCPSVNSTVEKIISQFKPKVVIIGAAWLWYMGAGAGALVKPEDIAKTVIWLRAHGVGQVYVMGPEPRWARSLPLLLQANSMRDLPDRFDKGINSAAFTLEPIVRQAAESGGARFISALSALCDPQLGCLASAETKYGREPFDWDEDHFTAAGSKAAIDRLWPQF